jgi:hypothetical protein
MKPTVPLDPKSILALQRTAGNQHVLQLLRKRANRDVSATLEPVPELAEIVAEVTPPIARSRANIWWEFAAALLFAVAGYEIARRTWPLLPLAKCILVGLACGAVSAGSRKIRVRGNLH